MMSTIWAKYGVFDVVFCCGLLYHLDAPRKFVDLMAKACRRAAIIDTHVAECPAQPGKFALSDITENEGWAGRWFSEFDDSIRVMRTSGHPGAIRNHSGQ